MLKQHKNNLFCDQLGTVCCLWFLWCEDLTCDWLQHNKYSRHILGVHTFIRTAVKQQIVLIKIVYEILADSKES